MTNVKTSGKVIGRIEFRASKAVSFTAVGKDAWNSVETKAVALNYSDTRPKAGAIRRIKKSLRPPTSPNISKNP